MCSRTHGLPRALPAPSRLTLKNAAFPGGITSRWSRANNCRYYENQAAPQSPWPSGVNSNCRQGQL
jgi:hypothetical protein